MIFIKLEKIEVMCRKLMHMNVRDVQLKEFLIREKEGN